MKRLITLLMLIGSTALALSPQANTANVTINSKTGGRYDQFYWNIGSYNDQSCSINYNESLAGADCYFKMSQVMTTGQVTYLYITNITVSTTNTTWSIARTNLNMPLGIYLAEVYADDPNDSALSVARGKINVTRSLFLTDDDVIGTPAITNLTSYVRKDGDFDQFTGLIGTNGQIWVSDGSGGGNWTDYTSSNISGGTNILVVSSGTNVTVHTDGVLQTGIDANTATGGINTAAITANDTDISNLASTQQEVKATADGALQTDGSNRMMADLDVGGNSITNIAQINMGVSNAISGSAIGSSASVRGENCTVSGENAHAEGKDNVVSGENAHAEGGDNVASGAAAHAEGGYNIASGGASHASGWHTTASGNYSRSEVHYTTASGSHSHAGGENAEAAHDSSYVWSDGTAYTSTVAQSYSVYAANGIRLQGGTTTVTALDGGTVTENSTNILAAAVAAQATADANTVTGALQQIEIDANTSTGGLNTAAIAANDTEIAALVVTTALNTVTANAALPMDGSGVMSGNLNYGGYTPTNAAGYGMTTNDTTMYSGTLGGTNGVYWSQGGTNYWILFW